MSHLIMHRGPERRGTTYRLEGDEITIGRDNKNTITIRDNEISRVHIRLILTENGYEVCACGTVAEASSAFRQAEGAFDLVISDVVLPDGRGPELVFQLLGTRPQLAVLLTTGYVDENLDWERIRREQLQVLTKPFTVIDLLDQVRTALH